MKLFKDMTPEQIARVAEEIKDLARKEQGYSFEDGTSVGEALLAAAAHIEETACRRKAATLPIATDGETTRKAANGDGRVSLESCRVIANPDGNFTETEKGLASEVVASFELAAAVCKQIGMPRGISLPELTKALRPQPGSGRYA